MRKKNTQTEEKKTLKYNLFIRHNETTSERRENKSNIEKNMCRI